MEFLGQNNKKKTSNAPCTMLTLHLFRNTTKKRKKKKSFHTYYNELDSDC